MLFFWLISLTIAAPQRPASKFIISTVDKNGVKIIEMDVNADGKRDRRETWKNGFLEKAEVDQEQKGKFNDVTTYSAYKDATSPVSIREIDANRDGKIDRIEKTFEKRDTQQQIISTEVDTKFTGKFDKKWTSHTSILQDQVCPDPSHISEQVSQVAELRHLGVDEGEFTITGTGHKIHNSCFERWGRETFSRMLSEAMTTGMQCLRELSTRPARPNRAMSYVQGFERIWAETDVAIQCDNVMDNDHKAVDWNGTAARASSTPNQVMPGSTTVHPFIMINPVEPTAVGRPTPAEITEYTSTLFHEQFHNLGIAHGRDIEAAYGCETCCLQSANADDKEMACKICVGAYTGPEDHNYIRDMIAWSNVPYTSVRKNIPQLLVIEYMKSHPGDQWGMIAMAQTTMDIFSPLGAELARVVKNRIPARNMTPEMTEMFNHTQRYSSITIDNWVPYEPTTRVLAQAFDGYYGQTRTAAVLTLLETNKQAVRENLVKPSSIENTRYVAEGLQNNLKKVLTDIFLEGYPAPLTPDRIRAFELLEYFKPAAI